LKLAKGPERWEHDDDELFTDGNQHGEKATKDNGKSRVLGFVMLAMMPLGTRRV
jgi:hypothetical protein